MLTHLDHKGRACMVDVGDKPVTRREATAYGEVRMSRDCLRLIRGGRVPKGDVFSAARLAGIMAAKRVDELIPLCHGLPLDAVQVDFTCGPGRVSVTATIKTSAKTGVEMEALTAASVACLTIYDMAKAVDKSMTIGSIYLLEKKGGRSGHYLRRESRVR